MQLGMLFGLVLTALIVFCLADRYDKRLRVKAKAPLRVKNVDIGTLNVNVNAPGSLSQSRSIRRLHALLVATKAASVIVALGGSLIVGTNYVQPWIPVTQRLETTATQQTRETLPDGSVAQLAPNSVIELAFDQSDRTIRLIRGALTIEVAKDPQRPLAVTTVRGVSVIAVGTVFMVKENLTETEIAVTEGTVRVITHFGGSALSSVAHQRYFLLHGGQDASVTPTGNILQGHSRSPFNLNEWPSEQLGFSDSRLGDVISEFNAHLKYKMSISDPELANLRISGFFNAYDPVGFLNYLERYHEITAVDSLDTGVILRRELVEKEGHRVRATP
jgi:transmembrane sensor